MLPCLLTAVLAMTPQAVPPSAVTAEMPAPTPAAPIVVLETTMGTIELRLDQEKAPVTVQNFLAYVQNGYYDGTIFHRVIPGFMIQGGGLKPDMSKKPTRAPIRNESGNGLSNRRGTIAMARANDPDSATSQFFINVNDNRRGLDAAPSKPGYAVFGRVVSGMDVADRIVAAPTEKRGDHRDVPTTPIVILSARLKTNAPEATDKPPDNPSDTTKP
jgi:peptidyl-prolyl cis-trans isomerase A (cyclophilin A)